MAAAIFAETLWYCCSCCCHSFKRPSPSFVTYNINIFNVFEIIPSPNLLCFLALGYIVGDEIIKYPAV
jgi:hypothetical protein